MANPAVKIIVSAADNASAVFRKIDTALNGVARSVLSLQGAVVGLGAGILAKGFVDAARAAEKLEHQLDTVTKGKGKDWYAALDEWADKMPVTGDAVINTFIRMQRMGLQPTINMFQAMADTAYSMPGEVSQNFESIGEALAKIQEKGEASGKALNELTAKGIPAFDILREKFGLNNEQLKKLGENGVSAKMVIESIVEWMAKANAGQAEKFAESWDGALKQLDETWEDFQKAVMASGPFQVMKDQLKELNDYLASEEGKLAFDQWSTQAANAVLTAFEGITLGAQGMVTAFNGINASLAAVNIGIAKLLQNADKAAALKQMFLGDLKQFVEAWKYLNLPKDNFWGYEKDPNKVGVKQEFLDAAKQMEVDANASLDRAIESQNKANETFAKAREKLEAIKTGNTNRLKDRIEQSSNNNTTPNQDSSAWPELAPPSVEKTKEVTDEILKLRRNLSDEFAVISRQGYEREIEELNQYVGKLKDQAAGDVEALTTIDKIYAQKMDEINQRRKADYEKMRAEYYQFQKDYEDKEAKKKPGAFFDGFSDEFEKMKRDMDDFYTYGQRMARETSYAMTNAFDDFFFDVFKGNMKSLSDYFEGFANSILRAMSRMMAEQAAMSIMMGVGAAFAPSGASAMQQANTSGQMEMASVTMRTAANGDIFPGGFRAFASGGVVNKPTLGLIGEGRYNEAIVPLPDGRQIPVELRGGGSPPPVTVNVINQTGQPADVTQEPPRWDGRQWVLGVILSALQRNEMGLRNAVRSA